MKIYRPKFLLRWKFIYADGSEKAGLWNNAGPTSDLTSKAWCNNKEGMRLALIEAKNNDTRHTQVVAECPGQDFQNFQWIAVASMNPLGLSGPTTPNTRIGGLKIITRNEEVIVMDDGTGRRIPNTKQHINFATYGR